MKYLGYTKQDPYTYKGSGKIWRNHIRKHGNNVWTNILFCSSNKLDIKKYGLYYSKLWNVVASKEWANLMEEQADGGIAPYNHEANKINARLGGMAFAAKKFPAWNKGISTGREPETTRKKKSASHKGMKRSYREDGSWFWIKPLHNPAQDPALSI